MKRTGAVLVLASLLSACTATAPSPSAVATPSAGPSISLSATAAPSPSTGPAVDPPSTPAATRAPADSPPRDQGLSVQWQPAELDTGGLERVIVTAVVKLPAGGYLASGHGESDVPNDEYLDPLYWRSADGLAWDRTAVSGPSGFSEAESGPLGIVAIDDGEPWWSPDGVSWTKGDLGIRGEPRLWDVAVGDQAAVVISAEGAWNSTDGLLWEPVTGERVGASRLYSVQATEDGFIAAGFEWPDDPEGRPEGDSEGRVWRISPDGRTWRLDRPGDLRGPTLDEITYVWTVGDTALAIGTHGEADTLQECVRLYGGDCGNQWGVETAYRSVDGAPWKREYAVEEAGGEQPRLGFGRGGPEIEPWRDRLLALGLDGDSPLALHASTDGLTWERSWPRDQLPDLGYGFISTFFVDGDLAIVSGVIEAIGDDSDQEYFMQVGTITP